MIKPSVNLQELRRRIYRKAKAEKQWRFWGLYVHVSKPETLRAAYQAAKANDGTPGFDGESLKPSRPVTSRSFSVRYESNFLHERTSRRRTGGSRYQKGKARRAGWGFLPSRIEWSRER
jgi:hypothetical protein